MDQLEQYWQFGAALIFVLALIGILFWVLQRIGLGGGKGRRGTRLGIVEAAVVDKKRRLVLIRRDSVEHLVMIGGPQDVVVENNISRREPSLAAGKTEPPRGGVIPELAVRAVERGTPPAQPPAVPEPKRPEPVSAEAAKPPEPPQEKPLPHPEEPARRAAPPVVIPPEDAARLAQKTQSPALEPVKRAEPAASAAQDEPVRRIEPHGPLPDTVARRVEPQAVGTERAPQVAEEPRPFRETPPPFPVEASASASQGKPWPPSEGRFREAQRRFAERSDIQPQVRGDRTQPAEEPEPAIQPERPAAVAAESNGMSAPDSPREVSQQDGSPREPANLNLRPGEDR